MCFRPAAANSGPIKCPVCGFEAKEMLDECPNCKTKAAPNTAKAPIRPPGAPTMVPPAAPPAPKSPGKQ